MKFTRSEVRKIIRHEENIDNEEELKKIFTLIHSRNQKFSCKLEGFGPLFQDCSVIQLMDDGIRIFTKYPEKMNTLIKYSKINSIEVISNSEFIEEDSAGRWSII